MLNLSDLDLSNEALVNLFHGLRMAPCDFNQEQITSLLQELTGNH